MQAPPISLQSIEPSPFQSISLISLSILLPSADGRIQNRIILTKGKDEPFVLTRLVAGMVPLTAIKRNDLSDFVLDACSRLLRNNRTISNTSRHNMH
ncbi:hypothetical protein CDAR_615011 [Caerostris darwini]|uniref:Uncharacterized protein n=1 Tax=Caerostris darwini TaxID=1538125 RepID=A0AAV4SYD8_9ARAC|nr:hypothetical protein CDAR_615011 [Caerostris darwini]